MILKLPQISIVYPVFNEADLVADTIHLSAKVLAELGFDFEIIVVDDGSTDATSDVLEKLCAELACLKVLRNPTNQGQGKSILKGFAAATKEYVIHNGIDYPFDLRHLPVLFEQTSTCDVVVAERTSYTGYPFARRLVSQVNRFLIRSLFNIGLKDCNFVQLYKTKLVTSLPVRFTSVGFVTTELLLLAGENNHKISQVGIPYGPRRKGSPRNSRISAIVTSLCDLLRCYFQRTARRFSRALKARNEQELLVTNPFIPETDYK